MNHERKKQKKNLRQGFTLIEILLYIGLVSGVLIAASLFAWNIIGSKTKSRAMQEVSANGTVVIERLTHIVRSAQGIDPSSQFGVNLAAEAGTAVIFDLRESTIDPTVIDVQDGVLRIGQGANTPGASTSNLVRVTELTFTNLSLPSEKSKHLGIVLTIEHVNPNNQQEQAAILTFRSAVELRDRPR